MLFLFLWAILSFPVIPSTIHWASTASVSDSFRSHHFHGLPLFLFFLYKPFITQASFQTPKFKQEVLHSDRESPVKMSTIAETWMGELARLKEKILPSKPREGSRAEPTVHKEASNEKDNRGVRTDSSMMSEASVCLLMDRFVPW
ncbi:uncharacterized protein LOC129286911 [Prosopis cineraria]|uniref:uncharacterized protein LOC129286911 n=1 Tax=Prosopis cineraria TaxID=364024 RepID=UPI00240F10E8|nr:uncharacterized protein LOC129286911 [Prosopis cineraria]